MKNGNVYFKKKFLYNRHHIIEAREKKQEHAQLYNGGDALLTEFYMYCKQYFNTQMVHLNTHLL